MLCRAGVGLLIVQTPKLNLMYNTRLCKIVIHPNSKSIGAKPNINVTLKPIFIDLTDKTKLQNEMVSPNKKSREDSNDHSTIHNVVNFLQLGENSTEMGSFYTYPSPKKQTKPKAIFIDLTDKTKLRNKVMFQNSNEDSKNNNWNATPRPKVEFRMLHDRLFRDFLKTVLRGFLGYSYFYYINFDVHINLK